MELELELMKTMQDNLLNYVSILVLMELELEPSSVSKVCPRARCFYPCFNGIRVGTNTPEKPIDKFEIGFYPCFNGIRVGTWKGQANEIYFLLVSILVLMELELEQRLFGGIN